MKRNFFLYILSLLFIFSIGAVGIYFLSFGPGSKNLDFTNHSQGNNNNQTSSDKQYVSSSSESSVEGTEISNRESEEFDVSQVYFENIEKLYPYLSFNQVEDLKSYIQTYIHDYIDPKILDCVLNSKTISKKDNIISFDISIKDSILNISVAIDDNGKMIDISIVHDNKQ